MAKRSNCRLLYYYEDDVVEYTQRGKVKYQKNIVIKAFQIK